MLRHGVARLALRRIAATDADQRKFLGQALGARIRTGAATVVAMVDQQHRHLDRAEIEAGQRSAGAVGIGHRRAEDNTLHGVAETRTQRSRRNRAATRAKKKNLRTRKPLLQIAYQCANVGRVILPQAERVAHAPGKLVRRRIDDDVCDVGVGHLVLDANQEIRRRPEFHRALLRAPLQSDRAQSADEGDDDDLRRRGLVLVEQVGQRDAAARRKGEQILRSETGTRQRGEQQDGEPMSDDVHLKASCAACRPAARRDKC